MKINQIKHLCWKFTRALQKQLGKKDNEEDFYLWFHLRDKSVSKRHSSLKRVYKLKSLPAYEPLMSDIYWRAWSALSNKYVSLRLAL